MERASFGGWRPPSLVWGKSSGNARLQQLELRLVNSNLCPSGVGVTCQNNHVMTQFSLAERVQPGRGRKTFYPLISAQEVPTNCPLRVLSGAPPPSRERGAQVLLLHAGKQTNMNRMVSIFVHVTMCVKLPESTAGASPSPSSYRLGT